MIRNQTYIHMMRREFWLRLWEAAVKQKQSESNMMSTDHV